ncbi:hypothetical protein [Nostoc sp. 'Peltigera malacea cyanobiont' DB3992]|nr:hypothetical protein [Nostoc sp. 'Peltigera malacea cyanobiont' DB3992]
MKFLTALPVTDLTRVSYRFEGHWGLGTGDWGLGIRDVGIGQISGK